MAFIIALGWLFSSSSQAVNIDISGTVIASPCVVNGGDESLAINLGMGFRPILWKQVAALPHGLKRH